MSTTAQKIPKLIDIGSNLGDPVFRGNYHGKQSHPDDFPSILSRSRHAGVGIQLLTGDCISGSSSVLSLANEHEGLFSTVGCHPCRANEMVDYAHGGIEGYIEKLEELIVKGKEGGKVRAVGECGLDYDRLFLSSKEAQLKAFPPQLSLATKHSLPLFLHSRNCHLDFIRLLRSHPSPSPIRGVVHSFTGTLPEALDLISLSPEIYIGLNGCSLKTSENLSVVKELPLERLMIESDCPWCEIRPSHASYPFLSDLLEELKEVYQVRMVKKEKFVEGCGVKGRNEPISTGLVAWVVSKLKGVGVEEVAETTTRNAQRLFGFKEEDGVWEGSVQKVEE
ncbi:3'-5'-exodeoxyribonuclease [Sporobolomyces salmoneus]|uniref:3'-5'-exodeoxyribonuclease n=1 Tax=Sporobolomyces salmoneus TaxID=183962 RepID=UPI00317C96FA